MENYFTNTIEWLNRAQRIAGIGIWNQEIAKDSLWWSDETFRMFGMEPQSEEMDFEKFLTMVHRDDRKIVVSETKRLLETHENPYIAEYKIITKKGKTKILYEEASIEFDSDHKPIRIIGIIKDITQQRENEAQLVAAKEKEKAKAEDAALRLEIALSSSREGFFDINYVSNTVYYSPIWKSLLGYEDTELENNHSTFINLLNPRDKEKFEECINKSISEQSKEFKLEFQMKHKTGKWIDVESTAIIFYNDKKEVIRVIGKHVDVTEEKKAELALKESEKKYRLLVNNLGEGIANVDENELFIFSNNKAEMIFGVGEGELVGKSLKEFLSEKDYSYIKQLTIKRKEGHGNVYELEIINKKKRKINLLITPTPEFDINGNFKSTLAVFRDITDRKKAEQAIIDSEEKLKLARLASGIGISEFDIINNILLWDAQMFRLYDVKPDTFGGTYEVWQKAIHPDDLQQTESEFQKAICGEKEFNAIFRVIWQDGSIHYIRAHAHARYDINGKVISLIGAHYDITEIKETEQALIDSELRWKFAVEGNADGLWDWDLITNKVFFSKQLKKMMGFSENEMPDDLSEWDIRVHPDDKEKTYQNINCHINGETDCYENEYRLLCKNNTYKWFLDRGKIISYNSDKKAARMIGILSDITDRKKAEQALIESESSLRESNNTKDKFFSIIAHDLRSPFNSMLGFSKLLNDNFDDFDISRKKEFTKLLYQRIQDTYKLLENILTWSRTQMRIVKFNPEQINLFLVAEEIGRLLSQSAEDKSITMLNQISENIFIHADKDMLSTIIRNLLSNAIKFTPNGGAITINTRLTTDLENNKYTQVIVKDTGVGISKEMQIDLFDISKSTSTLGTEKERGTGLGLVLCKEFVEKHKGSIWIESEIGKGSSFIFSIPSVK